MPDCGGVRGGACPRGRAKLRKGGHRAPVAVLFTITEEEEGLRNATARTRRKKASGQHRAEENRASPNTGPDFSGSGPTCTPTPPTNSSPSNHAGAKADSLLCNKIDERQRLARERREEREKQNAAREAQWQEREERARQHYEKHLEERRRRLDEQRVKEDKRRLAVEEKRRQKLEEDKARHEAVILRTLARSQKTRQKPNRWSWGGAQLPNTPVTPAGFVESAFLHPLDLAGLERMLSAFSHIRRYGMTPQHGDRRSMSTVNLSKHVDPVMSKRLSYSSATLLPDRALRMTTPSSSVVRKAQSTPRLHQGKTAQLKPTGMRRQPLTPWENTMVNRLQQPTHSYLARSRSATSLSGEQAVSCHPATPMSFKALQASALSHCRSHDRNLSRVTGPPASSTSSTSLSAAHRSAGPAPVTTKERDFTRKSWSNLSLPLAPILSLPPKKCSPSPSKKSKPTAPSPGRTPMKTTGRPPTPKLLKSPGSEDPGNLRPFQTTPESLRPSSSSSLTAEEAQHVLTPSQPRPQPLGQNKSSPEMAPAPPSERVTSPPAHKPSAGTTDPEEASRILAEKRQQAREQREREEEQRRVEEEQQRLAQEEMALCMAEEQAQREEEEQRLAMERRRREEEERRHREEADRVVEEERLQKEREEAERLQKQKDDKESRQRVEAERLRQEREKHFQKEEAERLERKKRLEEIMKRTRRSEPPLETATPHRNGAQAVTPGSPALSAVSRPNASPGPMALPSIATPPSSGQRENGMFEEVIVLPHDPRPSLPEGEEAPQIQRDERVPTIAFRENGLLKTLTGVDEVSAQQETDVA